MPTSPPDLGVIADAVLAVAARVVAAEQSPGSAVPGDPIATPPLAMTPAYARLVHGAALDEIATLVLRLLVAAELDRNVHRLVRRLSADVGTIGTPVDGVITVVEGLGGDPVAALRALRPSERLIARGLVHILDPATPPLSQHVSVPARVVDFLVTGEPPAAIAPFAIEPVLPVASLCPVPVRGAGDHTDAASHVRRALASVGDGSALWLVGAPGTGRRTLLAAVAGELGKALLCVNQAAIRTWTESALVSSLWREVLLRDAIVCLHDVEVLRDAGSPDDTIRTTAVDRSLVSLAQVLVDAGLPVVFTASHPPPIHAFEHAAKVLQLDTVRRDDALALWRRRLPDGPALEDLASRFRLPPGRIVRALDSAGAHAAIAHDRPVDVADVIGAVSIGVAQEVATLGKRIEDTQTWSDIVLPADTLESVREMIARVRHRHQVLDRWGFRAKLAKGVGVAALFHGAPGTGKTMVANLIARELDQDLYQVDLSRMVSKWIGETEKNLAKVFDAAEGANVMLLFDEADALFSKRTEVSSSNDRHANAEVNYLLQRVERFEGVCIMTTNLESSIDTAFKRRLAFRIEFPMPDETERALLWRRMVPGATQLADDVDFDRLAAAYELAGGNIRNALLRAAFLAADRRESISMSLLEHAVRLEYRDAGKLGTSGSIYAR